MITNYKLKHENEEEVLYVYLDFSYEFALFNIKDFGKNLRTKLNDIIKLYKANKIKIIVDGLVIATLLVIPMTVNTTATNEIIYLDTINEKNNETTEYITKSTIENVKNDNLNNKLEVKDTNTDNTPINNTNNKDKETSDESSTNTSNTQTSNANTKKADTTVNKQKNTTKQNNTNTSNNTVKNNAATSSTNKENTNNKTTTESTSKTKDNTNTNTSTSTSTTTDTETESNKTYVTVHRSNGSVVTLELEEYLIGVVGSEMPASFNIEALKAQAIVARTYTLKRLSQNKTFTDTTSTQTYKNNNELMSMWGSSYSKYYNKIKSAVSSTAGVYITYNGTYIDAVYYSTSNGYTEDSIYVWGYNLPYLKSVDSHWDLNASSYKREVSFTFDKLKSLLKIDINKDTVFSLTRNPSNRVTEIKVNDTRFKGTDFRTKLGLRSTDFNIEIKDNSVLITTYGYGHGVGMSQYGANGMANEGYSYIDILKHYYQNIKIES